jgi:hypothetical protein
LKLLQLRLIRVIGGKLGVMMKLSEGIHAELVAALYLVKFGEVFLLTLREELAGGLKFLSETFVISY